MTVEWKQKVVTRRCCNPPRERRKCSSFSPTFLLPDACSPPRGEQCESDTLCYPDVTHLVQVKQQCVIFFFFCFSCRIRRDDGIVSCLRRQGVRFSLWGTLLRGMQGEWKFELDTRDDSTYISHITFDVFRSIFAFESICLLDSSSLLEFFLRAFCFEEKIILRWIWKSL